MRTTLLHRSIVRVDPASVASARQLKVGDLATVDIGAGELRCAHVTYVDTSPGRAEWCWLDLQTEPPRGVVHVRLEQLRPGCELRRAATK